MIGIFVGYNNCFDLVNNCLNFCCNVRLCYLV